MVFPCDRGFQGLIILIALENTVHMITCPFYHQILSKLPQKSAKKAKLFPQTDAGNNAVNLALQCLKNLHLCT